MHIRVRLSAAPDERFWPRAFEPAVGQALAVRFADQSVTGHLVAAEVVDDGRAALLTLDVPGGIELRLGGPGGR